MQTHRAQIKKRRNRLMLALVSCIILVVFVSLIVMMTSPTGYERRPIPTEESLPDAFQLTATFIVGQVTETALAEVNATAGIATLQPTPTLLPFTHLEEKWRQELEEWHGFAQPVFQDIIQFNLDFYDDNLDAANHARVASHFAFYDSDPGNYIAVEIHTSPEYESIYLLLYYIEDSTVERLLTQKISVGYTISPFAENHRTFRDYNGNGLVNIAYVDYEQCEVAKLMILELSADEIIDISPLSIDACPDVDMAYRQVNIDDDAHLEFVGFTDLERFYSYDFELAGGDVVYKWNGERYAKVDD